MNNSKATATRLRALLATFIAAFALVGCEDGLFEVKNPGRILDEDLNTTPGVNSLVTGMSSDFSASYDNLSFTTAILSDEIVGSGSYFSTGRYRRGLFDSDDANGFWGGVQRARWVAEAGLIRMRGIEDYQFDGNPNTARAWLILSRSDIDLLVSPRLFHLLLSSLSSSHLLSLPHSFPFLPLSHPFSLSPPSLLSSFLSPLLTLTN